MANADKPMGFRVGYTKHGGPPIINKYLQSGTAVIYQHDVIVWSTSNQGYVKSMAGASEIPIGVSAGYYASGDTTIEVLVYDDLQNTVFIAQADGADIAAASNVGGYFDVTVGASTTSPISIHEIDSDASTKDTLWLIDKVNRPDNAYGANVECYVEFAIDQRAHARTNTAS